MQDSSTLMEPLHIEPYRGVGRLRFGMSDTEVIAMMGEPTLPMARRQGCDLWYFDKITLIFENKSLVEIGCTRDSSTMINGVDLFLDPFSFKKLCAMDGDPKEILGAIILFNLGISLTGFHDNDYDQLSVTAFERGRWDSLRPKMRDYP